MTTNLGRASPLIWTKSKRTATFFSWILSLYIYIKSHQKVSNLKKSNLPRQQTPSLPQYPLYLWENIFILKKYLFSPKRIFLVFRIMFGISKVTLCKSRIALTGVWIARIFLFPYKRLQKSGVRNKKSFEKDRLERPTKEIISRFCHFCWK